MEWKNFKIEEFACSHCGKNETKDELVSILQDLRDRLGVPVRITSGYRCPEYNKLVSTTGAAGPHTTGLAADIAVEREAACNLLEQALQMPFRGIGINQKGGGRFVHLDILTSRPTRTMWSY